MTSQPSRPVLIAAGIMVAIATVVVAAGCGSAAMAAPLDLSGDGVDGPHVVKNLQGETLLYNFRTVETGVLYRGSDFARTPTANGQPAAFKDEQAFAFLRARNIRHVVSLVPTPDFYVEEGYLRYWTERTGYIVTATSLPVAPDQAYARNERSGLHAAAELIDIMRRHRPGDGAVLIHGEDGKDATGIAAAAYELWRNAAHQDPNAIWAGTLRRYMASNALLSQPRHWEAVAATSACRDNEPGLVCAEELEALHDDLLFVAALY